mmetsp:Transcript_9259/g.7051  ORF Transcript_9259/g.7051 Transcript_9259/m.7051 type:complete len:116 (+) Transcript_9259:270-617(+)
MLYEEQIENEGLSAPEEGFNHTDPGFYLKNSREQSAFCGEEFEDRKHLDMEDEEDEHTHTTAEKMDPLELYQPQQLDHELREKFNEEVIRQLMAFPIEVQIQDEVQIMEEGFETC